MPCLFLLELNALHTLIERRELESTHQLQQLLVGSRLAELAVCTSGVKL